MSPEWLAFLEQEASQYASPPLIASSQAPVEANYNAVGGTAGAQAYIQAALAPEEFYPTYSYPPAQTGSILGGYAGQQLTPPEVYGPPDPVFMPGYGEQPAESYQPFAPPPAPDPGISLGQIAGEEFFAAPEQRVPSAWEQVIGMETPSDLAADPYTPFNATPGVGLGGLNTAANRILGDANRIAGDVGAQAAGSLDIYNLGANATRSQGQAPRVSPLEPVGRYIGEAAVPDNTVEAAITAATLGPLGRGLSAIAKPVIGMRGAALGGAALGATDSPLANIAYNIAGETGSRVASDIVGDTGNQYANLGIGLLGAAVAGGAAGRVAGAPTASMVSGAGGLTPEDRLRALNRVNNYAGNSPKPKVLQIASESGLEIPPEVKTLDDIKKWTKAEGDALRAAGVSAVLPPPEVAAPPPAAVPPIEGQTPRVLTHDDLPTSSSVVSGPSQMRHGTKERFEVFDEGFLDGTALYGPGVYLTNSDEIAGQYAVNRAKKSGLPEGVMQTVDVPADARLINLEAKLPDDAVASLRQKAVEYESSMTEADAWEDAARAAEAGQPGTAVYRAFKDGLDDLTSVGDAAEALGGLNDVFRGLGYDGLAHIGGVARGGQKHLVNIIFDPERVKVSNSVPVARKVPGIEGVTPASRGFSDTQIQAAIKKAQDTGDYSDLRALSNAELQRARNMLRVGTFPDTIPVIRVAEERGFTGLLDPMGRGGSFSNNNEGLINDWVKSGEMKPPIGDASEATARTRRAELLGLNTSTPSPASVQPSPVSGSRAPSAGVAIDDVIAWQNGRLANAKSDLDRTFIRKELNDLLSAKEAGTTQVPAGYFSRGIPAELNVSPSSGSAPIEAATPPLAGNPVPETGSVPSGASASLPLEAPSPVASGAGASGGTPPPTPPTPPASTATPPSPSTPPPSGDTLKDNLIALPSLWKGWTASGDVLGVAFRQLENTKYAEPIMFKDAVQAATKAFVASPEKAEQMLKSLPRWDVGGTVTSGGKTIEIQPLAKVFKYGDEYRTPGFEVPNQSKVARFGQAFPLVRNSEQSLRAGMMTAAALRREQMITAAAAFGAPESWFKHYDDIARISVLYGDIPRWAHGLSNGFYSLRNMTARFQNMTQPITKPGPLLRSPSEMIRDKAIFSPSPRGVASRNLTRWVAGEVANLQMMAAMGRETGLFAVGTDPLGNGFGRVEFDDDKGNTVSTDILGGYGSMIKAVARSADAAAKGEDSEFDIFEEWTKFFRNKAAPLPAAVIDTAVTNVPGLKDKPGLESPFQLNWFDPSTYTKGEFIARMLPFFAGDPVDLMLKGKLDATSPNDLLKSAGAILAGFAGVPASIYGGNIFEQKAAEEGLGRYYDLDPAEQARLTRSLDGEGKNIPDDQRVIPIYRVREQVYEELMPQEFRDAYPTLQSLEDKFVSIYKKMAEDKGETFRLQDAESAFSGLLEDFGLAEPIKTKKREIIKNDPDAIEALQRMYNDGKANFPPSKADIKLAADVKRYYEENP